MKDATSHSALHRACTGADAKHALATVRTKAAQNLADRPFNS